MQWGGALSTILCTVQVCDPARRGAEVGDSRPMCCSLFGRRHRASHCTRLVANMTTSASLLGLRRAQRARRMA